jgi:adenylosuccinate lyase
LTPQRKELRDYRLFSPTDFRYSVKDLLPYLSEEAYVGYKARVEAVLACELANWGICNKAIADEIAKASYSVRAVEVYREEDKIKHDIRALANIIRRKVSKKAKPFVHLSATSYDIVDTANALRFKDAIEKVILPDLARLEEALIEISKVFSHTIQVGRTHGQHAEPITFGFFLSYYVSRVGKRIIKLKEAAGSLVGKFAGAVGVYGPLSLLIKDPERFEAQLLRTLGLKPCEISTQIVQAEAMTDLAHTIVSTFGVLGNFARDMRNLQRTEIDEVSESFGDAQVGSSTMPQKRNPISFENVESLWKKFMPQMVTAYMDQISEHQRDLTNSSSQRYLPELLVAFDYSIRRLTRTIWDSSEKKPKIIVNTRKMLVNLRSSLDWMRAEPLYIILASAGHPDAHEYVRRAVKKSEEERRSLREVVRSDPSISKYLASIPEKSWKIIEDPQQYTGIAAKKAQKVAERWRAIMARNDLSIKN